MSRNRFNWPLAISNFTLLDKARISAFLFREPMWTYGAWVKKYEDMWVEKFGCKHAIMVSSGSAANELIALRRKCELQRAGDWPRRNKVVFPVNTWISSVSVWINLGFEPVFLDVCRENYNVTYEDLYDALSKDETRSIGTVFYTALLGYSNDLEACKRASEYFGARFLMDNCEASFSYYSSNSGPKSILTLTTCSTSIFFSHLTSSGTEGGLIFAQTQEEADWYRMARSHGLTRGMPDSYKNPAVSPDFDFYLLGSNYRSSNLQAYMASLDFERACDFGLNQRRAIFNALNIRLDPSLYNRFGTRSDGIDNYELAVPLAIPILCKTPAQRQGTERRLKENGVMTRPIIGGNLLRHTAFQGYGNPTKYPVAQLIHENGFYIGLHPQVTVEMAKDLADYLNTL